MCKRARTERMEMRRKSGRHENGLCDKKKMEKGPTIVSPFLSFSNFVLVHIFLASSATFECRSEGPVHDL